MPYCWINHWQNIRHAGKSAGAKIWIRCRWYGYSYCSRKSRQTVMWGTFICILLAEFWFCATASRIASSVSGAVLLGRPLVLGGHVKLSCPQRRQRTVSNVFLSGHQRSGYRQSVAIRQLIHEMHGCIFLIWTQHFLKQYSRISVKVKRHQQQCKSYMYRSIVKHLLPTLQHLAHSTVTVSPWLPSVNVMFIFNPAMGTTIFLNTLSMDTNR